MLGSEFTGVWGETDLGGLPSAYTEKQLTDPPRMSLRNVLFLSASDLGLDALRTGLLLGSRGRDGTPDLACMSTVAVMRTREGQALLTGYARVSRALAASSHFSSVRATQLLSEGIKSPKA